MSAATSQLYFCSQPRSFERLDLMAIAAAKRAAIRQLCHTDNWHGLIIALFVCLWVLGGEVASRVQALPAQMLGCGLCVTALLGFSIALHEASHRLLFRNATLNELAGLLCGAPVLIPISAFRTNHRFHHQRRGGYGASTAETLDFALFRTLPVYCLGNVLKSFGFVTALPVVAILKAQRRVQFRTLGEYLLLASAVILAVHEVPAPMLWRVWGLPLLIAALLSQVRAVAEHGLTAKGNVFTASRTVVSSPALELLMCNINYHLEHHLFPGLPWYHLPLAHALLEDEYRRAGASVYRTYRRFYGDFLRATWRGIRPHARLIAREDIACRNS